MCLPGFDHGLLTNNSFTFDLYTKQIKPPSRGREFSHIESLREKLLNDRRIIAVRDLGSGKDRKPRRRQIASIARTSLSSQRYSVIFSRLAQYFGSTCIIELGTSFGINTLYLAEKADASVTTFEGSPAIADIAALTFEFASKQNIELIIGNINRTLPVFLHRIRRVDLAFMDANHQYEPTIQYFEWLLKKVHEKSVIIIDDIHHSREMERAWKAIKSNRLVYGSVDLFRCGMVFFDPSLNKQHVILQV